MPAGIHHKSNESKKEKHIGPIFSPLMFSLFLLVRIVFSISFLPVLAQSPPPDKSNKPNVFLLCGARGYTLGIKNTEINRE